MKFYQKIVHLHIFCPSVKNNRYLKQQQNRNPGWLIKQYILPESSNKKCSAILKTFISLILFNHQGYKNQSFHTVLCICPIHRNTEGQVGHGYEWLNPTEDVPAHHRWVGQYDLQRSSTTQNTLWFCSSQKTETVWYCKICVKLLNLSRGLCSMQKEWTVLLRTFEHM